MSHDPSPNSRRNFLKMFGLSTSLPLYQSPLQILIESIVLGAARTARAQAAGLTPRNLVHISLEGAPPRWVFDNFLTPYSTNGFIPSAGLGTAFNFDPKGASVRYSTIAKSGLNVPHMWQYQVPAASGGMREMDPLLANLLLLRGIEIGNPDHGAAQAMQFVPNGSTQSLTSLSADVSNAPLAAVNLALSQYRFISPKGKSAVTVSNGDNMIRKMLTPFTTTTAGTFLTNKNKLGSALDSALNAMNATAAIARPEAAGLGSATNAARDLMSKGFGDLNTKWNALVSKYNSLITRSLDPKRNLPGLNDAAIVNDGSKKFQIDGLQAGNADLRSAVVASMTISRLADHFAVTEYVLTSRLSTSIAISPQSLWGFKIDGNSKYLGFDEHETGGVISTLLNTYLNIAYAACLLELIDQLKAQNIFNETVIVMGGEFGRNPRADGFGSDHGYLGGTSAIYTGAFTGPLVLGNIYNGKTSAFPALGTWGVGAPVAELGRALSTSDWASTVASLLRVPSPTTAAASLLVPSGGGYTSLIEKAKQI